MRPENNDHRTAKSIFISYPHKDAGEAADFLHRRLKGAGYRAYKDDQILRPGTDFSPELLDRIAKCDCFVVLLNSAAVESDWVNREIETAQATGRHTVPLLLDQVGLPPALSKLHALKMRDRATWWDALHKLVTDLEDGDRTIPRVWNLSGQQEFEKFDVEGVLVLNESRFQHVDLNDPQAIAPAARALVDAALPCLVKLEAGIVPPGHSGLACAVLAFLMGHNLLPRMHWSCRVPGDRFRISDHHVVSLQDLREEGHQNRQRILDATGNI
jgi:hypothetical protein